MKKRILALVLTLALLVVGAAFAVSASEADGGSTTTYTGIEAEDCPCGNCDMKIGDILTQGTELSTSSTTTGHYYANGAAQAKGFGSQMLFKTANQTVVIYLKDTNLGKTSAVKTAATADTAATYYDMRTMTIGYNVTGVKVYVIGNNGVLTGAGKDKSASNNQNGGLVYLYSGSELHLMGDLEVKMASNSPNKPHNGGLIYSGGGTITVSDDVVMTGTTVNAAGGTIYTTGNLTVQDNAVIQGGIAGTNGGNIFVRNKTLTLKNDAQILNGKADRGGNVYLEYNSAGAKLTMSGGTISGGAATNTAAAAGALEDLETLGGNVYVGRACTANISGGEIKDGKAENGTGGNLGNRGTTTISGSAKLTGGIAKQGGNIYSYDHPDKYTAAHTDDRKLYGKLTISGGTIDGGTATAGNGGAVYANGCEFKLPKNTDPAIENWVVQAGLTISGGTIQNGEATGNGGNLYFANTTAAISGTNTVIDGGAAVKGGNICAENDLTVSGGTIQNGTATTYGGNVYITGAAETIFTLSNGTITGGVAGEFTYDEETKKVTATTTAGEGGNICTDNKAKLVMSNGTVSNGKAYLGGNFRNNTNLTTTSYSIISGGTVSGGEAFRGGNIYSNRRMTVNGSAVIEEGKALHTYRKASDTGLAFGGNWMAYSNNQTLTGSATVQNGYSDGNGGNIAAGIGGTNTIIFNLSGSAIVTGGEAGDTAGNIYAGDKASASAFNMSGGTVSDGTAPKEGSIKSNNIFVYSMPMNFTGGKIEDTSTTDDAGTSLVISGDKLTLGGKATVNYHKGPAVYLSGNSASLHVNANFTGEVWLFTWGRIKPKADGEAYGTKVNYKGVTATTTAGGVYTGQLLMSGSSEADYESGVGIVPVNTAAEGETATYELYFASAEVVTMTDGVESSAWYATVEDAVAAASGKSDRFVALYKDENTFTVAEGQEAYINFRNKKATVTNNGTVYGFDRNASTSKDASSEVTVTGNAFATHFTAPTGYFYVALVNEDVTTFHRLDLEISNVSLRVTDPTTAPTANLYYSANIKAGPALREKLTRAGVAVTLKENATSLATDYMFTNEGYKADGKYHGALVKGIVFETKAEASRAEAPIFAKAYVTLGEGENAVDILSTADISMSLKDVVNAVAEQYYSFTDAQKANFDALYDAAWFQGMFTDLTVKVTTKPEEV